MTLIEALLLGVIQGLTEFLPVSSSGHLVLSQYLLGFTNLNELVDFTLACHLGTLLAVCLFFWKPIKDILIRDHQKMGWILIGTLPLFPLALLSEPIKGIFDQVQYLGYFFLITALLLYFGSVHAKLVSSQVLEKRRWQDSALIGLFQALAILPGVSRSGSTIAGARLLGWPMQEAISYSFLLSIPAILGASLLEFGKIYLHPEKAASLQLGAEVYALGFTSAFLVGCGALTLLVRLAQNNKLIYFSWYCLFLGIVSLIYFNV